MRGSIVGGPVEAGAVPVVMRGTLRGTVIRGRVPAEQTLSASIVSRPVVASFRIGLKGEPGEDGPAGATGATGPAGPQGDPGPTGPAGTSDHSALINLAADGHTQYHTDARGDARYAPLAHVGSGGAAHANAVPAGAAGFMTGADKAKLDGVATGAEVNVNADWTAVSGDALILNKPSTFAPSAHVHAQADVTSLTGALAALAPLASPALTGNPTAPTPTAGDSDTSIATTAFVNAEIAADVPALATAAVATHVALADPHTQYRLESVNIPQSEVTSLTTDLAGKETAGAVATHVALADPHTQYQRESEKAAANGYASLDAGTLIPAAQLPASTTTAKGAVVLGGGTANFLRADGAWALPPGGGGAHAATHRAGGGDAVQLTQAQVDNLTTDLNAKALATGSNATGVWASAAKRTSMNGFGTSCALTFQATPAGERSFQEAESGWGGGDYPRAGWWLLDNIRHSNGSNYWGTQFAYGWEGNANELWQRNVSYGVWGSWVRYWNSGNDGSGSGLDADLLDGYHAALGATANTIVQRDASGSTSVNYLFSNYVNQASANNENPEISQFIVTNSIDGYNRKASLAHVRAALVPVVHIHMTSDSGQGIAGGATNLQYEDTVSTTHGSAWDGSTFTVPTGLGGVYAFNVSAAVVNSPITEIQIWKNGVRLCVGAYIGDWASATISVHLYLTAGEAIKFRGSLGGTRTTSPASNYMMITRLGG